jgi:hypothetical protein
MILQFKSKDDINPITAKKYGKPTAITCSEFGVFGDGKGPKVTMNGEHESWQVTTVEDKFKPFPKTGTCGAPKYN